MHLFTGPEGALEETEQIKIINSFMAKGLKYSPFYNISTFNSIDKSMSLFRIELTFLMSIQRTYFELV